MTRDNFRWQWIVAIFIGFGVGLTYAWLLSPVRYVDAEPQTLRADFKDDFRSAIAAAFSSNGDLDRARARLDLLGDEDTVQTLTAQAQRMLASGESLDSIQQVAILAAAMQGQPAISPTVSIPISTTFTPERVTQDQQDSSPTLTLEASSQIIQAESTTTGAPLLTATPRPTRTATPTLGAPFQLVGQDTICDPELSEGLLQVVVTNSTRVQIPGVEIIISWTNGEEHFFTGLKPEIGNGYADFVMDSSVKYSLRLREGGSPVTDLSAPSCIDSDNNPYFGGLRLTFQQP